MGVSNRPSMGILPWGPRLLWTRKPSVILSRLLPSHKSDANALYRFFSSASTSVESRGSSLNSWSCTYQHSVVFKEGSRIILSTQSCLIKSSFSKIKFNRLAPNKLHWQFFFDNRVLEKTRTGRKHDSVKGREAFVPVNFHQSTTLVNFPYFLCRPFDLQAHQRPLR